MNNYDNNPGGYPAHPDGAYPPNQYPQGGYPPGGYPPNAYPPGAYPQPYPQQPVEHDPGMKDILGTAGFWLFISGLVVAVFLVILGIALAFTADIPVGLVTFGWPGVSYATLAIAACLGGLTMLASGIVIAVRAPRRVGRAIGFIILGIIFFISAMLGVIVIVVAIIAVGMLIWSLFW